MPKSGNTPARSAFTKGGNLLPALCNALGILLLLAVFVLAAPLALPPLFGSAPMEIDFPVIGSFKPVFDAVAGKIYLLLAAACGIMLNVLASILRSGQRARTLAALRSAAGGDNSEQPNGQSASHKRTGSIARTVAVVVLVAIFVGSAGIIAYTNWQYDVSDSLYTQARSTYTKPYVKPEGILGAVDEQPPITVDFASLQAENPDVVGWVYCEGTPIDYPVLQGVDDEYYLTHDYTGDFNINGAIFVDSDNRRDFADAKTIVYGHHMNSGSMFASLLNWESADFYVEHPVIWLLTPAQNYRVEIIGSQHVSASSGIYRVIAEPGDEMNAFLADAQAGSDYATDVALRPKAHYVVLSTCAYLFDDDRYVVYGMLVPVGK